MSYSTNILDKILQEVKEMSIEEYNRLYDEVKENDIRIVTENYSVQIVRRTVSYISKPWHIVKKFVNIMVIMVKSLRLR